MIARHPLNLNVKFCFKEYQYIIRLNTKVGMEGAGSTLGMLRKQGKNKRYKISKGTRGSLEAVFQSKLSES